MCIKWTSLSYNIDDGSGGSGVASGVDRYPDRTKIYFRLQIQGYRKLIPCFHTSVYSEKTRLKKLMMKIMMMIIIIMNKSQETTIFSGHQKLTSA